MSQQTASGDVLEAVIEGMNEGTPWAIVRHYLITGDGAVDDIAAAIASKWATVILPDLVAVLTDDWVAECFTCFRVAPKPMSSWFFTFNPAQAGEVTTDGIPNGSACILRLTTDEVGARNRGRLFLCGIPEASTNGGCLTAAALTAIETATLHIQDVVTSGAITATPCIFSRSAYNIPPEEEGGPVTHPEDPADYTSVITNITVTANLGSQRRRRYRRDATR